MRAFALTSFEGPASLELVEVPEPQLRPLCVKLEVRAIGINALAILERGEVPGKAIVAPDGAGEGLPSSRPER